MCPCHDGEGTFRCCGQTLRHPSRPATPSQIAAPPCQPASGAAPASAPTARDPTARDPTARDPTASCPNPAQQPDSQPAISALSQPTSAARPPPSADRYPTSHLRPTSPPQPAHLSRPPQPAHFSRPLQPPVQSPKWAAGVVSVCCWGRVWLVWGCVSRRSRPQRCGRGVGVGGQAARRPGGQAARQPGEQARRAGQQASKRPGARTENADAPE